MLHNAAYLPFLEQLVSPSIAQPVTIGAGDAHRVSGMLLVPPQAHACFVLAHGAGAGMTHPFMEAVALEILIAHDTHPELS